MIIEIRAPGPDEEIGACHLSVSLSTLSGWKLDRFARLFELLVLVLGFSTSLRT